jgi:hypothetical protein
MKVKSNAELVARPPTHDTDSGFPAKIDRLFAAARDDAGNLPRGCSLLIRNGREQAYVMEPGASLRLDQVSHRYIRFHGQIPIRKPHPDYNGPGFASDDPASLTFSTQALGHDLRPGVYKDAQRAPSEKQGHPGLDWDWSPRQHPTSAARRHLDSLGGNFTIHICDFDPRGELTRFAAEFEIADGRGGAFLYERPNTFDAGTPSWVRHLRRELGRATSDDEGTAARLHSTYPSDLVFTAEGIDRLPLTPPQKARFALAQFARDHGARSEANLEGAFLAAARAIGPTPVAWLSDTWGEPVWSGGPWRGNDWQDLRQRAQKGERCDTRPAVFVTGSRSFVRLSSLGDFWDLYPDHLQRWPSKERQGYGTLPEELLTELRRRLVPYLDPSMARELSSPLFAQIVGEIDGALAKRQATRAAAEAIFENGGVDWLSRAELNVLADALRHAAALPPGR